MSSIINDYCAVTFVWDCNMRTVELPIIGNTGLRRVSVLALGSLLASQCPLEGESFPLTAANAGQTFLVGNGDVFTDSGGPGAFYENDEDRIITFAVPAGLNISANFTSFFTEDGFDFLKIFDGPTVASPSIGSPDGFTGNANIGTVIATGNTLTFRFESDFIVPASGWVAEISVSGGATLEGSVWSDLDADGAKEPGENGLAGFLLELVDVNGHAVDDPGVGGYQAYTVLSGPMGEYSFAHLIPDSYQVRIAAPEGSHGTSSPVTNNLDDQQADDDNGIQSENGGEVISPVIVLTGTEVDSTVDFGFVPSVVESYVLNSAPSFDWFDGSSGVTWAPTDTSKTHDISYTDSQGNTRTVTVTLSLIDPNNRNGDTAADLHGATTHPFDPAGGAAPYPGSTETDLVPGDGSVVDPWDSDLDPILTETSGEYGAGFLTMGIKVADSRERVGYRFSFSKPVELSNLEVAGIDSLGVNFANSLSTFETVGDSYQDRVEFYGRNGDEPVALTIVSGSELISGGGAVFHDYDTEVSGVLAIPASEGIATVSSVNAITELEIFYSNGNDDAVNEREQTSLYTYWSDSNGPTYGASDDQGVRISGFDLLVADDASIAGFVLADGNRDGSGDSGISEVSLTLFSDPDGDGDPTDGAPVDHPDLPGVQDYVVMTGLDGGYEFVGLAAGDYVVAQTQPAGYLTSSDGDSIDGEDDAINVSAFDDFIPVSVALSERDDGNDFVEALAGALSGSVLVDTDNDGDGDLGLETVLLTLKDSAGDDIDSDELTPGVQPTTVFTDSNGDYSFSNLLPADYEVVQTQPTGFVSLGDADGGDPNRTNISVFPGATNSGNDFEEVEPGSITGFVLADTDNDNFGDEGIEDVVLTLKTDFGEDIDSDPMTPGVQPTTTMTIGNGAYVFGNLIPNFYQVHQTQPAGFDSVSDTDGENNNIIGDELEIEVFAGTEAAGNNFVEEAPGSLSGLVQLDVNNNGAGDAPIGAVLLTLKNSSGDDLDSDELTAGVQPTTTTTDSGGSYSFANLSPGNYRVVQTQPEGFLSVSDVDGENDNVIGDENPLVVSAGSNTSGQNFLEEQPGAIAGMVLVDIDGNGSGDSGLAGVTLTLKTGAGLDIDSDVGTPGTQPTTELTSDGATDVDGDTVVDAVGDFYFGDLRPGSYQIVQSQPLGYDSVSDSEGLNDNVILVSVLGNQTATGNVFVEEEGKPDTYGEWQVTFATALGSEDELSDNPDGDRHPNALEYALCLHPGTGLESNSGFIVNKDDATGEVTAEYSRPIGNTDVTYTLQAADTLDTPTNWVTIASVSPTVDGSASGIPEGAEKVTFSSLEAASEFSDGAERGVVRLTVTIGGQDFSTSVYGWQCQDYNDYQLATFSHPFSKTPVFSGTFPASGTLTLSSDGSGNRALDVSSSAAGADLGPVVGSGGEAFFQITSGTLEGERFDILSGAVDSLTLVNDPNIFSENDGVESLNTSDSLPSDSVLYGASYEVIFYQTLDEIFPRLTTYSGEETINPGDATRLLFFNTRRDEPGFDSLILIGTQPTDSKWVFSNDLLWQVDRGSLRLEPGQGNWIQPKSSGDSENPSVLPPIRQTSFGMVAAHDQACAMNEGFNLLGAMWPFDQSPAGTNGRDLTVAAGFQGGTSPNNATELFFWNGDLVNDDITVTSYSEGYTNYMLLDGGGMQNWIDINDLTLTNQDELLVLESHRATVLKLLTSDQKKPHFYPQPAF